MRAIPLLLLLGGCAITRGIVPLDKGEVALHGSLGGPFMMYAGAPIPVPITELGVMYGLTDHVTAHASLYPTQLATSGVFGMDIGAYGQLFGPNGARPRLVLDGTAYMFGGDISPNPPKGGFRLFPDAALIASWDVGPQRQHHLYAGVDGFFEFFPTPHAYPTPLLGAQFRVGRVGLQAEARWVAWNKETDRWFIDWVNTGKYGIIGANIGMTVYLGKKGRPGKKGVKP